MNDSMEFWFVDQFVELGNESFWHEKALLHPHRNDTEQDMSQKAHHVGCRDVKKHGGRYRIRVVKEETVFDSKEGQ